MAILKKKWNSGAAILSAALLTLAAMSAARADAPAVLNQIPADSNAVIVIGNVKNLSTKLSNAITRLNVPIPVPPDLAGYALRNAGITEGFDQDSSAAIVILKPASTDPANPDTNLFAGPPPAVLLLPTTDSKAMLQNLSPSAPDKDGISEVVLPGDTGDKGYVANVDKWVAFSQDRDVLTNFLSKKNSLSKTLSPDSIKAFENNDLVIWSNTSSVGPSIQKTLEDKQQELTGMIDLMNLNNNQDQTTGALQKEMVNLYFGGIKQFFKDADQSMVTLRLSDSGLTLGTIGSFKAGTPFGKFIAAQKPAQPPTLQGLPDGEFLMSGAFVFNGPSMADLVATVSKQVLANEVIAQDPKVEDYKKLALMYQQLAAISSGANFVILPAPIGGKNGVFSGAYLVDTSDPAKYRALATEAVKLAGATQGTMNPDIKEAITVTPDAVTIKEIKLTKIHITFALRDETPDHPLNAGSRQGMMVIEKMYGTDGMTVYSGVVGKRVLSVFGSDQATLEGAVDAALSNNDTLSSNAMITGLKDQVVPNTVGYLYLPLARWVTVAQSAIHPPADGQPAPVAPQNVAPILVSGGVNGNTLTVELHIPINAITSTMEAGMKFKQSMSGGGPPPATP